MVLEKQVRKYLSKLDVLKSMGHDEMHSQLHRELADMTARL